MPTKVITWSVVIFLAFYLIISPTGGANLIRDSLGALSNAGNMLAGFIHSL